MLATTRARTQGGLSDGADSLESQGHHQKHDEADPEDRSPEPMQPPRGPAPEEGGGPDPERNEITTQECRLLASGLRGPKRERARPLGAGQGHHQEVPARLEPDGDPGVVASPPEAPHQPVAVDGHGSTPGTVENQCVGAPLPDLPDGEGVQGRARALRSGPDCHGSRPFEAVRTARCCGTSPAPCRPEPSRPAAGGARRPASVRVGSPAAGVPGWMWTARTAYHHPADTPDQGRPAWLHLWSPVWSCQSGSEGGADGSCRLPGIRVSPSMNLATSRYHLGSAA